MQLYENDAPPRRRARSSRRASRCRPTARSQTTSARSRTSTAPPLPARHRARVEAGDARRRARVSDRLRPARASRSTRRSRDSACARRPCCASCRRAAPSARSSTSAIPGSCASIRAGIRRRCSFVALGFEHILDGIDHLLFIFCLVIPFRRIRPLVAIVTSFTVAHSITLIASAAGLRARRALVPAADRGADRAVDRVHGAREHRRARSSSGAGWWRSGSGSCTASASRSRCASRCSSRARTSRRRSSSFNVGVELGQLFVLALAVPALDCAVHARRRRANGDDHPLGVRRAHGVALDARSRRGAARSISSRCRRSTPRSSASVMRGLMLLLIIVGAGVAACSSSTAADLAAGARRPACSSVWSAK